MASFHPGHLGLHMRAFEQDSSPLPYTVLPFPGELLSSWLMRLAVDYQISLTQLCQHLGVSIVTSPITYNGLEEVDIRRIAASTQSSSAASVAHATPARPQSR